MDDLPASLSDLDLSQDIPAVVFGYVDARAVDALPDVEALPAADDDREGGPPVRPFPQKKGFAETVDGAAISKAAKRRLKHTFCRDMRRTQTDLDTQTVYAEAIAREFNTAQLSVGTLALPTASMSRDVPRHTQQCNAAGIECKALQRVGQIATRRNRTSHW